MGDKNHTVAEIIREQAAIFIRNEANTEPLITVTRVDVSPNFKSAIVLITTIPVERENDALIFLGRHAREFRGYIKRHTKLKYLPHITFAIDNGERQRQRLDEIINQNDKSANSVSNTSPEA